MKIALVLRSGGDYSPADVQWLVNQLPKGYEVICLTDMKGMVIPGVKNIPLIHKWRYCKGWWAKIELFRPDIKDDLLYLDLDTVITGDISDLLDNPPKKFTMLRDFYHPQNLASGIMWIPNRAKNKIWKAFWSDSEGWISRCITTDCWGDQGFIQKVVGDDTQTFNELYPGWFRSYKADIAKLGENIHASARFSRGDGSLPAGCRVVVFHGKPRPRTVNEPWIPGAPAYVASMSECESA